MLNGKKIILGVSGGIAAYKTPSLVRLLVKEGAIVRVVMTPDAQAFVTPLTLATVSKNPVCIAHFNPENGVWENHVELGMWADLLLIAPATANTLAKMANGICDNLLLSIYLSARCKVIACPAMDLDMYVHEATVRNLHRLQQDGVVVMPAASGELASGLSGQGRLHEPEEIANYVRGFLSQSNQFKGKHILVTAGPTYESIDPVRFIGNHSSGKMGFAIAESFAMHGANVTLITGPTDLHTSMGNITRIDVQSAAQMYEKTVSHFKKCDVAIMSAAVADYTPEHVSLTKIKKKGNELHLKLKRTVDILAELGKLKTSKQLLIGFALETNNEIANATDKLKRKNLDMIILNSLQSKGAGFKYDTNQVIFIDKHNQITEFALKSKTEVAQDIVKKCLDMLTPNNSKKKKT
jgi:phosphopantothenoylcysteine decarboxylase/phosphopantothenate--cysteine ligase